MRAFWRALSSGPLSADPPEESAASVAKRKVQLLRRLKLVVRHLVDEQSREENVEGRVCGGLTEAHPLVQELCVCIERCLMCEVAAGGDRAQHSPDVFTGLLRELVTTTTAGNGGAGGGAGGGGKSTAGGGSGSGQAPRAILDCIRETSSNPPLLFVATAHGRMRAWIRLALNRGIVGSTLAFLASSPYTGKTGKGGRASRGSWSSRGSRHGTRGASRARGGAGFLGTDPRLMSVLHIVDGHPNVTFAVDHDLPRLDIPDPVQAAKYNKTQRTIAESRRDGAESRRRQRGSGSGGGDSGHSSGSGRGGGSVGLARERGESNGGGGGSGDPPHPSGRTGKGFLGSIWSTIEDSMVAAATVLEYAIDGDTTAAGGSGADGQPSGRHGGIPASTVPAFGTCLSIITRDPRHCAHATLEPRLSVPDVLGQTIRTMNGALASPGLFRRRASEADLILLRQSFEAAGALPAYTNVYAAASLLVLWLDSLPDGLLGHAHFDAFVAISTIDDVGAQVRNLQCILGELPAAHKPATLALFSFLHRAVLPEHTVHSGLDVATLAKIVAPVVLRRLPGTAGGGGGGESGSERGGESGGGGESVGTASGGNLGGGGRGGLNNGSESGDGGGIRSAGASGTSAAGASDASEREACERIVATLILHHEEALVHVKQELVHIRHKLTTAIDNLRGLYFLGEERFDMCLPHHRAAAGRLWVLLAQPVLWSADGRGRVSKDESIGGSRIKVSVSDFFECSKPLRRAFGHRRMKAGVYREDRRRR